MRGKRKNIICLNFICLYKKLRREGSKGREGRQFVFHILLVDEFFNLFKNLFSTSRCCFCYTYKTTLHHHLHLPYYQQILPILKYKTTPLCRLLEMSRGLISDDNSKVLFSKHSQWLPMIFRLCRA